MKRREFLKNFGVLAVSFTLLPEVVKAVKKSVKWSMEDIRTDPVKFLKDHYYPGCYFQGHEWQKEFLDNLESGAVVHKCSNVGMSELMIRRNMYLCEYYGLESGYIMPSGQTIKNYIPKRFWKKV